MTRETLNHRRLGSFPNIVRVYTSDVIVTLIRRQFSSFTLNVNKQIIMSLLQTMEKLNLLFKNWTPRIRLNTFVPNFSISQIRLKSKFKTNFYDSKSKLKNVLLHTFPLEMSLKFSP